MKTLLNKSQSTSTTLDIGRRSLIRTFGAGALLTVLALAGGLVEAQANVRLAGTVGAVVITDNAVVPPGATVTLNGTVIRGNLIISRRATVIANGVRVLGNVETENARTRVTIQDGSIVDGSIQALNESRDATAILRVYGSTIRGDVEASKYAGMIAIAGNTIEGNLQLTENRVEWSLLNNAVKGDLQAFKNFSTAPGIISGNLVLGNLQTGENFPVEVINPAL